MATLTQIAKNSGVSVALVSRMLRGDPSLKIPDRLRSEILETKEQLGGSRTQRRRRKLSRIIVVPTNRMFTFGWVQSNVTSTDLFKTFEKTLQDNDFRLHFTFFDPDQKNKYFESLARSRMDCDGLVLLSNLTDEFLAQLVRQYDIPHISFDPCAERYRVNTVCAHMLDGLRQAVEHLYELGHRRIGYLGQHEFHGYPLAMAVLMARDLPSSEDLKCWVPPISEKENIDEWSNHARIALTAWLERGINVTALICQNDYFALGAVAALRAKGLEPGRDVSLIGYDNIEKHGGNPTTQPILTTIDNPTDLIGRRASELLLNQIHHNQNQIVHERIPSTLVIRQTTGPCIRKEDSFSIG